MDLDLFISVQGTCGITARIIIHISMGYQGDSIHVEVHGPLVISGAWVSGMKLFYSTTQDRNISKLSSRTERYPKQVSEVRVGFLTQRSGSCSSRNGTSAFVQGISCQHDHFPFCIIWVISVLPGQDSGLMSHDLGAQFKVHWVHGTSPLILKGPQSGAGGDLK